MGVTGAGKSEMGNFIFKKPVFESGDEWDSTTSVVDTYTGTVGDKCLSITDTIGFLGQLATKDKKGLSGTPKDASVIGFVIGPKRCTTGDLILIQKLLEDDDEAIPYIFLIFTHARNYGVTEEDQRKKLNHD